MKFKIYDGRCEFFQWDTNQKVLCPDINAGSEVHFAIDNAMALTTLAYDLDGVVVADVPNVLLQSYSRLRVFAYVIEGGSSFTKYCTEFTVKERPKPSSYVYTETDVVNYRNLSKVDEELRKQIKELDGKVSAMEFIAPPKTAEVGQTIVVKSVDENGQPTEWEAADFPDYSGAITELSDRANKAISKHNSDIENLNKSLTQSIESVGESANKAIASVNESATQGIAEVNKKIDELPQPDLAQNDPTAKDYVKNRTHYVIPATEVATNTLTWDGNTEGKEVVEGAYYKVSDSVCTVEDLIGGTLVINANGASETVELTSETVIDNTSAGTPIIVLVEDAATIVLEDYTVDDLTITKGIYFISYNGAYISSLTAVTDCFTAMGEETVVPFDGRYLPNGLGYIISEGSQTATNTLTWDGNTEGLENIPMSETAGFYKISNTTVAITDFIGATVAINEGGNVTESVITEELLIDMSEEGISAFIVLPDNEELDIPVIYVFNEDFSAEGLTATKGVYFFYGVADSAIFIQSITCLTDCFVGGTAAEVKKIDNRLLDVEWLARSKQSQKEALAETTLEFTSQALNTLSVVLQLGNKYTAYWNGVEYPNLNVGNLEEMLYIGNLSILGAGINTGEPFLYACDQDGGYTVLAKTTNDAETITFRLVATITKYDKLPLGFLPDEAALKSDIPTVPNIPTTLPNPYYLTFTGAVSATYNGNRSVSVNIPTAPAKISELENDAGYITADDVPAAPSKVSELENDAGYITADDVPAAPTKLPNPNALTFTGAVNATYDGNKAVSINLAGKNVEGKTFTIDGESVTAGDSAEVFNNTQMNKAVGDYSHAEGGLTTASGYASHAEGNDTTASGYASHAEGKGTTASGGQSHAEGASTTASGGQSHAEGASTTASGYASHAEGKGTTALSDASHAEGGLTTASVYASHAEGASTTASGYASHAEGKGTTASVYASHAEGNDTTASGYASHAEGKGTTASGDYSHVQGAFNIEDTEGKYAHIVGNGSSTAERSNAHTLDWDGNAWFAGTVEGTALILKSSTEGSTKRFKITVDDSGTISATEVT